MEQVEIVDRDYSEVEEAENDSRKRKTPKIKLTATSANAFDWLYIGVRKKERKLEKVKEKIEKSEQKQNAIDEQQGIKGLLSFVVIDIKKNILHKKKFKLENAIEIKNRRAVRIENKMKKNILYKYFESLNNLNVNDINKDSIASAVDDAFNSMSKNDNNIQNINKPDKNIKVTESDAVVNNDVLNQMMANESVSEIEKPRDRNTKETDDQYNEYLKDFYSPELEFKTNYNENGLIEGTYRLKKDEIVQDDLFFDNKSSEEKPTNQSKSTELSVGTKFTELSVGINNQKFSNRINREIDPNKEQKDNSENEIKSDDVSTDNDVVSLSEDIYSKIYDSIEKVSNIDELNIVFDQMCGLKAEVDTEEKELDETYNTKVAYNAEKEKDRIRTIEEAKDYLRKFNSVIVAQKEKNKTKKTQIQQVDESTERTISNTQQAIQNIDAIKTMLESQNDSVDVTKESIGKFSK